MATVTTDIRLHVEAVLDAESPHEGGIVHEYHYAKRWESGTTTRKANEVYQATRTISGSSNEDLDLTALTNAFGDALGLAEVRMIIIEAAAANGAELQVKPSASNGWTALQSGTTDHVKVEAGCTIALLAPVDGAYAVSGTNKSINVANADGSNASYTITVLGTDA